MRAQFVKLSQNLLNEYWAQVPTPSREVTIFSIMQVATDKRLLHEIQFSAVPLEATWGSAIYSIDSNKQQPPGLLWIHKHNFDTSG